MDTHGGTEADVKKRISKARVAFHLLRNVWKSKIIEETTKIRLCLEKETTEIAFA